MKIIGVRSPYIISVDEDGQTATKIELRLCKISEELPSSPTYVLSKSVPSTTQLETTYNVSPFARDFIINKIEAVTDVRPIQYNASIMQVKRYYKTDGDFILIDTQVYYCLNGYSTFSEGANHYISGDTPALLLQTPLTEIFYDRNRINDYYIEIYVPDTYYMNSVVYSSSLGEVTEGLAQGLNYIPITTSSSNFVNGNTLTIYCTGSGTPFEYSFKATPVCEPVLTPVVCTYINKIGGVQQITFFKMRTDSIEASSDKYNLMPSNWDYDTTMGIYKQYNFNGKQSVKLNTGFVPEYYGELIKELMLSENIWLDGKPATVKTTSLEMKTKIRNKNINYELDFEMAYDVINTIV